MCLMVEHAELLQTLCNVRLEIGRSADVSSESADICAHIESSREVFDFCSFCMTIAVILLFDNI